MQRQCLSRQVLINSLLGLMLAGEKEGMERQKQKSKSASLLLLTNCLLLIEKHVSSVSLAGCSTLSLNWWLSI